MELKTLKDLKHLVKRKEEVDYETVDLFKIRQEAIKWVKVDKEILKYMILEDEIYDICNALVKIWMKRLDITEEDLKNET